MSYDNTGFYLILMLTSGTTTSRIFYIDIFHDVTNIRNFLNFKNFIVGTRKVTPLTRTPTKFWIGAMPPFRLLQPMELTVAHIGDVTRNDNRIVKLQNKSEQSTALGSINRSSTYYIAIAADTVAVAVDETVDLDLDAFNVTERPYQMEDGSLPTDADGNDIADNDGNPLMLKWLSLK